MVVASFVVMQWDAMQTTFIYFIPCASPVQSYLNIQAGNKGSHLVDMHMWDTKSSRISCSIFLLEWPGRRNVVMKRSQY